jgi:hypothetical protein
MPSVSHTGRGTDSLENVASTMAINLSSNATSTSRYRVPANRSWRCPRVTTTEWNATQDGVTRHAKRHAQLGRAATCKLALDGSAREAWCVRGPVLEKGGQPSTSTLNPALNGDDVVASIILPSGVLQVEASRCPIPPKSWGMKQRHCG